MPVPWDDHQEQQLWGSLPAPSRQAVLAAEGRARKVTQAPWRSLEDESSMSLRHEVTSGYISRWSTKQSCLAKVGSWDCLRRGCHSGQRRFITDC
ncbi:mCG1051011 [Mus musculus]|nr:mCG1051011 [Mus musculus]